MIPDQSITRNSSNKVDGIELVKLTDAKRIPKIKIDDAGLKGRLGDGLFVFRYQYIPETMTYKLKEVSRGFVTVTQRQPTKCFFNGAVTCSPKSLSSFNALCRGQDASSEAHH